MTTLNSDNYYDPSDTLEYVSFSFCKTFMECEALAVAMYRDGYVVEPTQSMLVGQYVHAWHDKSLDQFKLKNPDIFTRAGDLKAPFRLANEIIHRLSSDSLLSEVLEGDTEVILTGTLYDLPFKAKVDVINDSTRRLCDLKILRDFNPLWKDGTHQSIFSAYHYFTQIALYTELARQFFSTDTYYEPFIACLSKQDPPDKLIVSVGADQSAIKSFVDRFLEPLETIAPRIKRIRSGQDAPTRCERCRYCRDTKALAGTTPYEAFC